MVVSGDITLEKISSETLSFPQDFCGNPHGDPHVDLHMDIPTGTNNIPILNQFHGYGDPHMGISEGYPYPWNWDENRNMIFPVGIPTGEIIFPFPWVWGFPYPRQPWTYWAFEIP